MIKKLLTTASMVMLATCSIFSPPKQSQEEKVIGMIVKAYSFQQIWVNQNAFDYHECVNDSGYKVNTFYTDTLFGLTSIASRQLADFSQFKNIVIGDSTMHISSAYPEFHDESITQVVAVGANRVCDMIIQMRSINTTAPEAVVIATNGGNDMLAHMANDKIITRMQNLIDKVRSKFPNARIVVVGIHPTRISYGNTNKKTVNDGVKAHLSGLTNTCYIDPNSLFGVAEGDPAPESYMLTTNGKVDDIHYNKTMSLLIRDEIKNACGVAI